MPPGASPDGGGDWLELDAAIAARLFHDERARLETFLRFLARGHHGIVRERDERWVAYGWLAVPSGSPPHHVGRAGRGRYWIHYCRTADKHRGAGHYRAAVERLVANAQAHAGGPARVFIDTREDNAPARRAIERLRFRPAGVITIWRLPKTRLQLPRWNQRATHPTPDLAAA
jgi:RimJ/RimL family protein N-acetyltransferase